MSRLQPRQIAQAGATTSEVLAWDGTKWAPGTGGSGLGWSDFVKDYGADPTGAADCTAKLQQWFTDHAGTGGTLYVPQGVYLFSASPTTGTASGSGWSYSYAGQVNIPAVANSHGRITFHIVGDRKPTLTKIGPTGTPNEPVTSTGSIFNTTATSGSLFDAIPSYAYLPSPFTNCILDLENLTIRLPNNPAVGAVNAQAVACLGVRNLAVEVNASDQSISQPTHTGQVGIWCPALNNQAHVVLRDVSVMGCYTGVRHSEHAYLDRAMVQMNVVGIEVDGYAAQHAARYEHVLLQWNISHVKGASANSAVTGSVVLESKTSGGWWVTTYDFDDASGYLRGHLYWSKNGDSTATLLLNGAANITLVNEWTGAGASTGYATVQDEGTHLAARSTLDFVGDGVAAFDDATNTRTVVTIYRSEGLVEDGASNPPVSLTNEAGTDWLYEG